MQKIDIIRQRESHVLVDSVTLAKKLPDMPLVVWLNPLLGAIEEGGKNYQSSRFECGFQRRHQPVGGLNA